jgi:hypothetical protein
VRLVNWIRSLVTSVAIGLAGLPFVASSAPATRAPIHHASTPITDQLGRVQMIIDFADTAHNSFDDNLTSDDDKKWERQQKKVVKLINHFEKKYGFERTGMTSWVGSSATAFLTPDQIDKLAKDKDVKLLTENELMTLSALNPLPPWGESNNGTEYWSWGRNATIGKSKLPGTNRPIFIVDSGVAYHDDLTTVSERVNVACANGSAGACHTGLDSVQFPEVGCYPHATHVAGIIGSTGNNGNNGRSLCRLANDLRFG